MTTSPRFLNPSEASRRLGVSSKALRLYEQRGLVVPGRTPAGWRAYGPAEMERAAEIASLRRLGLSLAQVARVLGGDPLGLEPALAAHQAGLEERYRDLVRTLEAVRGVRDDLARGKTPSVGDLIGILAPSAGPAAAFDLPWPWGGERFELRDLRPLTYIVGPLGSGKTRLARRLAEELPGAMFLGLDRLADDGAAANARLDADPALRSRVDQAGVWLEEDGAKASAALTILLATLEADGTGAVVVDMVEQALDQSTQQALIAHLRRRGPKGRPLFLMTRSSSILDLQAVGADEAILLCPANHSPPTFVAPHVGAAGYEAVATCLGSPDVRARTEGVIAWRPNVA